MPHWSLALIILLCPALACGLRVPAWLVLAITSAGVAVHGAITWGLLAGVFPGSAQFSAISDTYYTAGHVYYYTLWTAFPLGFAIAQGVLGKRVVSNRQMICAAALLYTAGVALLLGTQGVDLARYVDPTSFVNRLSEIGAYLTLAGIVALVLAVLVNPLFRRFRGAN